MKQDEKETTVSQDESKMEENANVEPKNKFSKRRKVFFNILEGVLTAVFWIAVFAFCAQGIWATRDYVRDRNEERRVEAVHMQKSSECINWNEFEYLLIPPENVKVFLETTDRGRYFLDRFDGMIELFHDTHRPTNIPWNGDTLAIEREVIATMPVLFDLDLYMVQKLMNTLVQDSELRRDFFDWMTECVWLYSLPDFTGIYAVNSTALLSAVISHLQDYLDQGGLQKDSVFYAYCINHNIEYLFDTPYRIVEVDSAFYCGTKTIDNPYRGYEAMIYRLVNYCHASPDSVRLELTRIVERLYFPEDIASNNTILPAPPSVVANTCFVLDSDTVWLSDLAYEWILELKENAELNDEYFSEYYSGIPHLDDILYLYFDPVIDTYEMREHILDELGSRPELFKSLACWMSPTIFDILKSVENSENAKIRESLRQMKDYLLEGGYDRDLAYVKYHPEVYDEDEYSYELPYDYIVIDGETYCGNDWRPERESEIRLFNTIRHGIDKYQFANLLSQAFDAMDAR